MSLTPPSERLWWKEPIPRTELVWMAIAFLWGVFMFFTMIYWHGAGKQNLSNEAYRTTPQKFLDQTNKMVEKYQVREESGYPVVAPAPGEDIFLLARLWQWWPILELKKNETYRLHLASLDWQHGFSLQPQNINLQVHPGYDMVVTITPDKSGTYNIVCNEFCGLGHHTMVGKLLVVD